MRVQQCVRFARYARSLSIIRSAYPEFLSDVAVFVLYSGVRLDEERNQPIIEQILIVRSGCDIVIELIVRRKYFNAIIRATFNRIKQIILRGRQEQHYKLLFS